MAKKHVNIVSGNARVGIQAGNVTISGGLIVTDDDVVIQGQVTTADEGGSGDDK